MKTATSLFAAFLLFLSGPAAADTAPDALMKALTEEVLAAVRSDTALQAGDPARMMKLVEAKVLPHFDAQRATRIAVGAYWRKASPDQQARLVREFTTLLVRTYSGALSSYRNQAIEFGPLRARPGDSEVTVRSLVRQSGAEPVAIEYDLERAGDVWKVFDVRVAGISLVATYRSTFTEHARNHGVEGLIELLAGRNQKFPGALRM